jgi:hypothetical protein
MKLAVAVLSVGIISFVAVNSIEQAKAQNSPTRTLIYIGTFVVGLVMGSRDAEAEEKARLVKEAEEQQWEAAASRAHSLNQSSARNVFLESSPSGSAQNSYRLHGQTPLAKLLGSPQFDPFIHKPSLGQQLR